MALPSKPLGAGIAIILICGFLICGTAIVIQPTLATGRFYEITISSVYVGWQGELAICYDDRIAYGTEVEWDVPPHYGQKVWTESWSRRKPGFMRWPISSNGEEFRCYATTREEQDGSSPGREFYKRRVLVREGRYRLAPGESLTLYQYETKGGTPIKGSIRVRR